MTLIQAEIKEGILILKLDNGIPNPLGSLLLKEISMYLDDVRQSKDISGVIITSMNDKFFSIGLDVPELYPMDKSEFKRFYTSFNKLCIDLYTLPVPTMAAISGHATGGGCCLALSCDHRLMVEGKKVIGLNEVRIGVPVPFPVACILRDLVGGRRSGDIMESGGFYNPETARDMELVDYVTPSETLLEVAVKKIATLNSYSAQAWKQLKQFRVDSVIQRINGSLTEKEEYFIKCWFSEETRRLMKEALSKF